MGKEILEATLTVGAAEKRKGVSSGVSGRHCLSTLGSPSDSEAKAGPTEGSVVFKENLCGIMDTIMEDQSSFVVGV